MQLFEERVDSLFTDGPAVVVKVEQRKEPRCRSQFDTGAMVWDEFGVVIYTARAKAVPVLRGSSWVIPESAIETRFVKVPDINGSCEIPENAGRVLGHYRENGRRWWVFLEKLGSAVAPSPPAPGGPQKSRTVSHPSKAAPVGNVSPPAKPSGPPASPAPQRPQGNAAQGGR